ncbi:hypothetical protein F7U66_11090 [Vibrio parahaemolyticus]|nr:hypothetical protein [Vibrio parahaemolyticus]
MGIYNYAEVEIRHESSRASLLMRSLGAVIETGRLHVVHKDGRKCYFLSESYQYLEDIERVRIYLGSTPEGDNFDLNDFLNFNDIEVSLEIEFSRDLSVEWYFGNAWVYPDLGLEDDFEHSAKISIAGFDFSTDHSDKVATSMLKSGVFDSYPLTFDVELSYGIGKNEVKRMSDQVSTERGVFCRSLRRAIQRCLNQDARLPMVVSVGGYSREDMLACLSE